MSNGQTRRDVLRAGRAVGSLAVTGALSGCNEILGNDDDTKPEPRRDNSTDPDEESDSNDDSSDDSNGLDYQNWLFEPGTATDNQHYRVTVTNHQDIQTSKAVLGDTYQTYEFQTSEFPLQQMGVAYEEVDRQLTLGTFPSHVITKKFTESDIISALDGAGYREERAQRVHHHERRRVR